ncbi:MAG: beta-lactamase [Paenibacillus sp.]|nr:beta-lactamase [Paenibacillus sp.]
MRTFRKKSKCVILVSVASCWMLAGAPSLPAHAVVPQDSTFFSTTTIESSDTINTASQGDLWASCWADDGHLYAANGDGKGFTLGSTSPNSIPPAPPNPDIAVNRISGSIGSLSGATLATNHAVGQIWNTSGSYNRKPTGMVCVNGELYLAVQDLNLDFNDAPNATIAKSTDHGMTWTWNTAAPMFTNHTFTTIMFLDYGQNSAWNTFDNYVYAYGLDNNWRDSFDNTVSDPNKLFLARIPKSSIQNRTTWEFYTGDLNGNATWSSDINLRKPVLQDDRRIYASTRDSAHPSNTSVLSQGGIVYNKALNRYLYTSWTEYTFEFYEAPQPWGPWKKFMTKDFGGYPWSDTKNGGYEEWRIHDGYSFQIH